MHNACSPGAVLFVGVPLSSVVVVVVLLRFFCCCGGFVLLLLCCCCCCLLWGLFVLWCCLVWCRWAVGKIGAKCARVLYFSVCGTCSFHTQYACGHTVYFHDEGNGAKCARAMCTFLDAMIAHFDAGILPLHTANHYSRNQNVEDAPFVSPFYRRAFA